MTQIVLGQGLCRSDLTILIPEPASRLLFGALQNGGYKYRVI